MTNETITAVVLNEAVTITTFKPDGFGPALAFTAENGEPIAEIFVASAHDPALVARRLEAAARELAEAWEARAATTPKEQTR